MGACDCGAEARANSSRPAQPVVQRVMATSLYRVDRSGTTHPPTLPIVLAGATAFLDLYATQPVLPLLTSVFDASPLRVSLTITAATMAVAVSAPIVGRLADLIGTRRVIVASAFALTAATALAATSSSLTQLIGWRFLQGLITPGVFAIAMAYIHDEWPNSHVGRVTAAYVSGTVLGGFSGRAITGIVASQAGWRMAFVVLAVLNLAAALALWRWLPPGRAAKHAHGDHRGSLARVLRNRQLTVTNAVGFCVLFTQTAIFTYITFHLSEAPYLLGSAALGWLFVVYLFGAAVTPIAGRTIDRRGHRVGVAFAMAIGALGAALTLLPWLGLIVVGLALVATGVFFGQITASSYVGTVSTGDRGLSIGIYSMCYYAGGSLGAALPAAFWEWGGWTACVALVIAVQAVILALAWTWWSDRIGPEPHVTVEAAL